MSSEQALVFDCTGEPLVGILHRPATARETGVVVIVGGPQYRVGSHRQFTLLARELAAAGHAVLRFDCRGMGDSGGEFPGFEQLTPDIGSAIDALYAAVPGLRGVALWGLCDAASAALMYVERDPRVTGLVLANPWVRSEATLARAYLKHYYLARLLTPDFWKKLLSGRFLPGRALGDLAGNLRAGAAGDAPPIAGFVARMREGLRGFHGKALLVLSGNDYTAAEFESVAAGPDWQPLLARPTVVRHAIVEANHTFSTEAWRNEVAARTLELLRSL